MAELLDQTVLVFKGPVVGKTSYAAMAGAKLQYIGNTFAAWPVEWNPVLLHSPSGRVGDLWAVSTDLNFVLRHRGQLWARQTFQADNVSTGQDGTMMIASAGGIWRWDEESEASKQVGRLGEPHSGGSGQCKHVWGRCTDNTVHTFDTTKNTFNLTTIVRAAMDIAANADGTLWHCHDEDPNAYRFISEATLPSAKLPLGQATVTGVHKLASTGFGAAHCLAQLDDGSTQVYRYDSPYLFKTAQSYFVYTPLWELGHRARLWGISIHLRSGGPTLTLFTGRRSGCPYGPGSEALPAIRSTTKSEGFFELSSIR